MMQSLKSCLVGFEPRHGNSGVPIPLKKLYFFSDPNQVPIHPLYLAAHSLDALRWIAPGDCPIKVTLKKM